MTIVTTRTDVSMIKYGQMQHVTITLSEHDASLLLSFARRQVPSGDLWGWYWQRVSRSLEQGIERLSQERQTEREAAYCEFPGVRRADPAG